jgi:hypothetical protein
MKTRIVLSNLMGGSAKGVSSEELAAAVLDIMRQNVCIIELLREQYVPRVPWYRRLLRFLTE